MPGTKPIAIVGMACRLPGAPDLDAFSRLLHECRDAITEPPPDRRSLLAVPHGAEVATLRGGYLNGIDLFEPEFFGISPREAAEMDPQQRLALEVCYEALTDAGIAATDLRNCGAGVYLGISQADYGRRLLDAGRAAEISGYSGMSANTGAAAGRIAYWLGLHGPCMAVDTACSSSLTAIHLAVQALRAGECDLVLAGGVQLNLFPEMLVFLNQAKALAPDGRSKPFEARANGYGRGEGCGILALKRLEDAENDRVWAVIRGSAVNHDGPSSGFTVPNGLAQRALMESALRNAGVQPRDIQFLEAHGTGTLLGDPIELDAAGEVYSVGRAPDAPLYVGSVKANIGHLEAAAGVAGAIKAVLALHEGFIPGQPGFGEPNPRIPWARHSMLPAAHTIEWPASKGFRRAAVSAFGLSGSNAHIVLEQAEARESERNPLPRHVFDRRRFWMREQATLWDQRIESPLLDGALFTAAIRGERRLLFEEHCVRGRMVVPAAYYLAMVAAAADGVIESVVFPQAFAPQGGETLHLLVQCDEDGQKRFRVASDAGALHATGVIHTLQPARDRIDVAAVISGCTSSATDIYRELMERKIGLGERFRRLTDVRIGENEAIARVIPTSTREMRFAPGLVDACFQLLSPLIGCSGETLVPWRVGRCEFRKSDLDRAAWVHAVLPDTAQILDGNGDVLLRFTGIELRTMNAGPVTRPFAYKFEWKAVEQANAAESDALIFAPRGPTTAATLVALAQEARNADLRRLLVVTQQSDPLAGLLRGFTRCLAVEHPELRPVLVDLEHGDADARLAAGARGSAWRRIRGTRVEAARLVRMPLGDSQPLPLRSDATYLVTGGMGSLGRHIAEYLKARGAGRVVVCGRSGGDRVCDVSDAAQVRALIDDLPHLRGVVHAAGLRRDGLSVDEQAIEDAMAAKVRGAWNLHEATINRALDFFILVSSAAGTLGSPGQGAYGAANAALDGLAAERKRLGLPAMSVAWGPWEDSTMLAGLSAQQQQAWKDRGVRPLKAEKALEDLGALVASGESHVLYLDADWDRLTRMWGAEPPEFLEGLVARTTPIRAEQTVEWGKLPPEEARAQMTALLRSDVAGVLALDRPFASRTPFFDLGMDSLTALELRNRLQTRFGVPIPATLLFDCPSLEPLSAWMLNHIVGNEENQEPSESELERMLAAKLEELETRGLR